MAFVKNQAQGKGGRGIGKVLFAILFFPLKVRRRYLRYNAVLWEAGAESKALEAPMRDYRQNNAKLLNIFIYAPLALALLVALGAAYWQMEGLSRLAAKAAEIPKMSQVRPRTAGPALKRYFSGIGGAARQVRFRYALIAVGSCYGLSFIGALLLASSPAWGWEGKIKEALQSNRYLDFEGEPWKAYWTPDAIVFHTYQCDSNLLVANDKFWNTINFKPDVAVHFKADANKIVVGRAYSLPSIIDFSIKRDA
jgi:hypothetical protein